MLGVLTYLFYLLSKPNIPLTTLVAAKQIATAKVHYFSEMSKFFHFFLHDLCFLLDLLELSSETNMKTDCS